MVIARCSNSSLLTCHTPPGLFLARIILIPNKEELSCAKKKTLVYGTATRNLLSHTQGEHSMFAIKQDLWFNNS